MKSSAIPTPEKPKVLFYITEDWYFCSHRLPLAVAARDAGYDVVVVTRVRTRGSLITDQGLKLISLELNRHGLNPFSDLLLLVRLYRIYRSERPDIVHQVASKPVIYGSIAARLTGVKGIVNALAGLGFLFSSATLKARFVRPLVKAAYRQIFSAKNTFLIVQNPVDEATMRDAVGVSESKIELIRGSGVDTGQFRYIPEPEGIPLVILAARLLWEKGIGEFEEAARILRSRGVSARFAIVGEPDSKNPAALSAAQLETWNQEGNVECWGKRWDMPEVFGEANIVCLPTTYGEGVPKVLIEAAACGRPIVTTDLPGCRDIVQDKENGLLIPPNNPEALADALEKLIVSPDLRQAMGRRGRERVEQEFAIEFVVDKTLGLYRKVLS